MIYVITHKKFNNEYYCKEGYQPIQVGREGKENLGYLCDNTLNNISNKNADYCELTGLYWLWKNSYDDYIGICHYRRYFTHKILFATPKNYLKYDEAKKILEKYDIILPEKWQFGKKTVNENYEEYHKTKDLELAYKSIKKLYPEYLSTFKKTMCEKSLYPFNMMIMKKIDFDKYCKFIFTILFDIEKDIKAENYPSIKRIYGYISERLMAVWIKQNNYKVYASKVIQTEQSFKHNVKRILYRLFLRKLIY